MSNIDEKRQKAQNIISHYVKKVGLGKIQIDNEVENILSLSKAEIRRMSPEECGEAAFLIAKESMYVQLEINRISADINWCENYIFFLISETIDSAGGRYTPFEYRKPIAIKQNDVALQLQTAINNAKLQLESIAYVPSRLQSIEKTLLELQHTKRQQKARG